MTTTAAAPGRPTELETRSAMEARLGTALSPVGARCTRELDGSFESEPQQFTSPDEEKLSLPLSNDIGVAWDEISHRAS
jgi:hypothetical protein